MIGLRRRRYLEGFLRLASFESSLRPHRGLIPHSADLRSDTFERITKVGIFRPNRWTRAWTSP